MMGTLEALVVTPTTLTTLQLGSVAYDLVYIPIRIALFLAFASVAFDVHIVLSGLGPAAGSCSSSSRSSGSRCPRGRRGDDLPAGSRLRGDRPQRADDRVGNVLPDHPLASLARVDRET